MLFSGLVLQACTFSTGIPTQEELTQYDQRVRLQIEDVQQETKVYLRATTGQTSALTGASRAKYIDSQGKFVHNINVKYTDTSLSMLVFLDMNKNGILDSGDKGYSNFNMALSTADTGNVDELIDLEETIAQLSIKLTDFSDLGEVDVNATSLQANSQYYCIFTAQPMPVWSSSDLANYTSLGGDALPLSDWSSIAAFKTDGGASIIASTLQKPWLITNLTYDGICTIDSDLDGKYDYGSGSVVEVTVPAFTPDGAPDTFTIP